MRSKHLLLIIASISLSQITITNSFQISKHAADFGIQKTQNDPSSNQDFSIPVMIRSQSRSQYHYQSSSIYSSLEKEDTLKDVSSLPIPPGYRPWFLRNLRESISYLINPERFIQKRSQLFGPIFSTNIFFRPTVVVGGKVAVKSFMKNEFKGKITKSSLPDTFSELHTEYGALNMDSTDVDHQNLRQLFNDLFKPDALELYAPIIEEELDCYIANMRSRVEKDDEIDIYLVQELSVFCLNLFAKIFTGKDLSNEQVEDFVAYNKGLLSLSRSSKEWKAAKEALDRLVPEMSRRSENDTYTVEHAAVGDLISAAYEKLMSNYPENERSKRTGTSKTLFIWGAYIECAALMINSLEIVKNLEVSERSEIVNNILNDSEKKDSPNFLARGITRESLRLNPPAGGGFRTSDFDVDIAGYRIPAGTVITADPRIGNLDNNLYPRANEIIPERWIPSTSAESVRESACPFKGTALNQGAGSWFPGGIGGHQCPGVTLAETIASSFLIKFLKNFESWKISSGIDKEGNIKYVLIPIKIPVEDFSVRLTVRK